MRCVAAACIVSIDETDCQAGLLCWPDRTSMMQTNHTAFNRHESCMVGKLTARSHASQLWEKRA